MGKNIIRLLLFSFAISAVGYPIFVWYQNSPNITSLFNLFPLFGLIAFSTMWLHIVGAPFRSHLESYIDFEMFVQISSLIVLVSIILHPLLLLIALEGKYSVFGYVGEGDGYLIWIAIIAWVIFIAYDALKPFRNKKLFAKYWKQIKLISTLGFFLVLIHSLGIGRDLQASPLRIVWIFYGITATLSVIYTYLIKRGG